MWAHGWNASHPLRPLVDSLGLNVSRRQNYNSGAIYQPGGGRSNFLSYAQVDRGWTSVLLANITRMRAAAAAAAAAAPAAGAPVDGPTGAQQQPRDVPVLEPYLAWLGDARLSANAMRQANLLLHTRTQARAASGRGGALVAGRKGRGGHRFLTIPTKQHPSPLDTQARKQHPVVGRAAPKHHSPRPAALCQQPPTHADRPDPHPLLAPHPPCPPARSS
jgi:hypothetical protein